MGDPREVVGRVMAGLRVMFKEIVHEPAATLVTRWDLDPLARGSYSFRRKGWNGEPMLIHCRKATSNYVISN
eukprot:1268645-Amphidinium_carterae.1